MTTFRISTICLLSCLALSGCATSPKEPAEETLISRGQQEQYLESARPPQQFGFEVFQYHDGISYRGGLRLHPNHLTTAEFIVDDIPVIKIRGRSKKKQMNVLLDVSSATSWVEFSTALEFEVKFMGFNGLTIPYRGNLTTGGADAYAGVITQLRHEGLFMEDIPFYVRMAEGSMGPLARGIIDPHVEAVMGYDNLKSFEFIQFDMGNKLVKLSSSHPYVPHEELLMAKAKIINIRDAGLAVDDQRIDPQLGEPRRDGQPGLAAADHQDFRIAIRVGDGRLSLVEPVRSVKIARIGFAGRPGRIHHFLETGDLVERGEKGPGFELAPVFFDVVFVADQAKHALAFAGGGLEPNYGFDDFAAGLPGPVVGLL